MPSPSRRNTLQAIAYRAISKKTYHDVKKSNTTQKQVLQMVKEDVTMHHRSVKEWAKSIKIPPHIQHMLIVIDHHTQADYFDCFNKILKHNRKVRQLHFDNAEDYWAETGVYFNDDVLFNNNASEEEQEEDYITKQWPMILRKTFYCLCYRRLKKLIKIDVKDIYDKDKQDIYMDRELFDKIVALPESNLLPLTIYSMIDMHSRPYRPSRTSRTSISSRTSI